MTMPPCPSAADRTRIAAEPFEVTVVDPLSGEHDAPMDVALDPDAGDRRTAAVANRATAPEVADVAAFAAHPDWVRALAGRLVPSGVRVARVRANGVEVLRLPHLPAARGRSLRHPAHDHLTLSDLDVAATLSPDRLLDALDAVLRTATGRVGAVPAWRAPAVPEHSALVRAVRLRTGIDSGPIDTAGWALRPARETARFERVDGAFPVPGKLRRNLRRLRARLHENVDDEAVLQLSGADDPEALRAAFERFVALEAAGWKSGTADRPGTAIADDAGTLGFYRELMRPRGGSAEREGGGAADPGLEPVLAELRLGERTVAAKLALRTGASLHLLKIAYDESLAACAPGSLLLHALLERAPGMDLQRVSLVSSPEWAARWHPIVSPTWHVVRYADTAGGRLAAGVDRARDATRRHYHRVRTQRSSH